MEKPRTVDAYMAALPEHMRATLESLRATIRTAAPEAIETIAYDMPAFKSNGKFLVSFSAFKNHCACFRPAPPLWKPTVRHEVSAWVEELRSEETD